MSTAISPMLPEAMEQPLAELDAMRRMLRVSQATFSLSVAICNSQALRHYLIGRLTSERPGIEVVSVPAETTDPYGLVASRLGSLQPDAIFVVELERSVPSEETGQRILASLNASRELWQKRFCCPVVFWLPDYAATLLSTNALDLWRYCSHRFDFSFHDATSAPQAGDRISGDLMAPANLSRDEKHLRIAELQQRLADTDNSPDSPLVRHRLLWLNELASLLFILGEVDGAREVWQTVSKSASEMGLQSDAAAAQNNLGNAWAALGDARKAVGSYEQALVICQAFGDRRGEGNALNNLGNVRATLGNIREAIGLFERRVAIAREIGDRRGESNALGNLGNAWADIGDLRKAISYHEQNLLIAREIGDRRGEGNANGNLGLCWAALGDVSTAVNCYQQARLIAGEIDDRRSQANALFHLALSHRLLGERSEALKQAEQAARIYAAIESPHTETARRLVTRLSGEE